VIEEKRVTMTLGKAAASAGRAVAVEVGNDPALFATQAEKSVFLRKH
jgi:hypothetical protein